MHVVLLFHSATSENLGVGALTQAQVDILSEIAERKGIALGITIVDWRSRHPPYVTGRGISYFPVGRKEILNPWRLFRVLRRADLIIDIGGGDSLSDIYGPKRFWLMSLIKIQALLTLRPVVIAPQTIGPFTSGFRAKIASFLLSLSKSILTRDPLSEAYAKDLGLSVQTASDIAFRLQPSGRVRNSEQARSSDKGRRSGRVRVGINASGLLWHASRNGIDLRCNYRATLLGFIKALQRHESRPEIVLVGHVLCPPDANDDDDVANMALAEQLENIEIAPRFASPSEAKGFIADLDFFIGARMHACIAAVSSGVACVPMAYSRKFKGVFDPIGYQQSLDLTRTETDRAIKMLMSAYAARETLAGQAHIAASNAVSKLEIYNQALEELFDLCKARSPHPRASLPYALEEDISVSSQRSSP